MRQRHVIATALALGLGITAVVGARTAERATFILTSGERISGILAIRLNEGNVNIRRDKNSFELSRENNRAEYIPVPQVAAIDFIGGTPPKSELEVLVHGDHSLAMRDGSNRKGRFVDIMNAESVRWQRENSDQTEDIPIREIRRVYLNTGSVWNTFNFDPKSANQSGGAVAAPTPAGPGVEVRANQAWTDSGVTVRRGERMRFVASGEINFGAAAGQSAGPGGNSSMKSGSYPVPDLPVGALIGRVGNGQPFPIGASGQVIGMPAAGRLQLGINDDQHGDNGGAFRVQVMRGGEPAANPRRSGGE
jgi:hypothetical protein